MNGPRDRRRTAAAPAAPEGHPPGLQAPHAIRWTDADLFYEQLLDAHAGLTDEQSADLNARLILVLAHEVGDAQALSRCLRLALEAGAPSGPAAG